MTFPSFPPVALPGQPSATAEKPPSTNSPQPPRVRARTKGPWTAADDALLSSLVSHHGPRNWAGIAKRLPSRSGKQCRERWLNHLDPSVCKGPWSPAEDAILLRLHLLHGNCWAAISRALPGRTENATKNRWNAACKKALATLSAIDPEAAAQVRERAKHDLDFARALFCPAAGLTGSMPDMLTHFTNLNTKLNANGPGIRGDVEKEYVSDMVRGGKYTMNPEEGRLSPEMAQPPKTLQQQLQQVHEMRGQIQFEKSIEHTQQHQQLKELQPQGYVTMQSENFQSQQLQSHSYLPKRSRALKAPANPPPTIPTASLAVVRPSQPEISLPMQPLSMPQKLVPQCSTVTLSNSTTNSVTTTTTATSATTTTPSTLVCGHANPCRENVPYSSQNPETLGNPVRPNDQLQNWSWPVSETEPLSAAICAISAPFHEQDMRKQQEQQAHLQQQPLAPPLLHQSNHCPRSPAAICAIEGDAIDGAGIWPRTVTAPGPMTQHFPGGPVFQQLSSGTGATSIYPATDSIDAVFNVQKQLQEASAVQAHSSVYVNDFAGVGPLAGYDLEPKEDGSFLFRCGTGAQDASFQQTEAQSHAQVAFPGLSVRPVSSQHIRNTSEC